jgi:hypothetical protein
MHTLHHRSLQKAQRGPLRFYHSLHKSVRLTKTYSRITFCNLDSRTFGTAWIYLFKNAHTPHNTVIGHGKHLFCTFCQFQCWGSIYVRWQGSITNTNNDCVSIAYVLTYVSAYLMARTLFNNYLCFQRNGCHRDWQNDGKLCSFFP